MTKYVHEIKYRFALGFYLFFAFLLMGTFKIGYELITNFNIDLLVFFLCFCTALVSYFLVFVARKVCEIESITKSVTLSRRWLGFTKRTFSMDSSWVLDLKEIGLLGFTRFNYQVVLRSSSQTIVLAKCKTYEEALRLATVAYELLSPIQLSDILKSEMTTSESVMNGIANANEAAPSLIEGLVSLICPVEMDLPKRVPWTILMVLATVTSMSVLALTHTQTMVGEFGFIPSESFRKMGITWITHFFLHGDWTHLFGNLIFLGAFGRSLELRLGPSKLLLVLVLSTLSAVCAEFLMSPDSTIPMVGASGGIFGLMSFYMLSFPNKKFHIRIHWNTAGGIAEGKYIILYYLVIQFVMLPKQLGHETNIAFIAHLGGAFCGFLMWMYFRFTSQLNEKSVAHQ